MSGNPSPPDSRLIERLESTATAHAVTALAPLDHDTQKNRVRLKNLVQDIERAAAGFVGDRVAARLREQLDDEALSVRPLQRPGSWYVATDGEHYEHLVLPEPFPPRLVHDRGYYVRPLIQAASSHGEFLLLALSQGAVRLYRMSGEAMTAFPLDTLPASLTDVVGAEYEPPTLQHHQSAGTHFHGHGGGHDDQDREVRAFLREVDQALVDDSRVREHYLMIAAVDELASAYRDLSEHHHLLVQTVSLSPDKTSEEALRLAARDAFESWRERDTLDFARRLQEQPDHAADTPGDVVRAALEGRVDTLVTVRDTPVWGHFDEQTWSAELHDRRRANSRDLVDVAMRAAWRQGGRIRTLGEAVPDVMAGSLLARLRY